MYVCVIVIVIVIVIVMGYLRLLKVKHLNM